MPRPFGVTLLVALGLLAAPLRAAGEAAPGPAGAAAPIRLLVLDLEAENVDEASVRLLDGMLPTPLQGLEGLEVISGAELRKMAELEAEKATVGCEADSSCLAELAGALGAEYVLSGQIGQLGSQLVLNLQLFDSGSATVIQRVTRRAGSFDALAEEVPATVREAVAPLLRSRGIVLDEGPDIARPEREVPLVPIGVTALGGLLAVVGVGVGAVGGVGLWATDLEAARARYDAARATVEAAPLSAQGHAEASLAWRQLRARQEQWNLLVALAGGGAAAGAVGVAVAGAGTWMWLAGDAE